MRATAKPPILRLDSLTGLRFPAALAVFAFHSALPELPLLRDAALQGDYYRAVSQAGGAGVTFFFVLSGFVIAWSARETDSPAAFWRRRFVKILPLYYITCALAVLVMHLHDFSLRKTVLYLAMLQVWAPDYPLNFAVNAPGWSLAAEGFFYLVFPALLLGLVRLHRRGLWIALATTLFVELAIPAVSGLLPMGGQRLTNEPAISGVQYWFDYVFPPTRIPDFLVGMILARLVRFQQFPRIRFRLAIPALIVGYLLALNIPVLYGQRVALIVPCALLITAAAQRDLAGAPSVLRARIPVLLGEISFAFYLIHFSVLHFLNVRLLHGPSDSPQAIAVYFLLALAITLPLSWLAYTWIEMPLVRAWGGRVVRGFRGVETVSPATEHVGVR
ncbi:MULTISPECIES: acyltransferase [unclassified Nocardia]|uniref:acyltransferase family protein n=1 Tax=unclassified Nocardia TaxID=2637762 RepID=UPI001CE3C132|nr:MULTISPECIES: acyltransferase [unclassified Nocardia]